MEKTFLEGDILQHPQKGTKNLERHILAKNAFYLSYAHKKEDVDYYLKHIKEVFSELYELIQKNEIEKNLLGPIVHTGFSRLA